MRKSLEDLNPAMIRKVNNYPDLPDELVEYCYYLSDCGYSIMAIPECLLSEHIKSTDLWEYEVPMPVKYVLATGYRMFEGYVIVKAKYDNIFGLVIDGDYDEY